MTKEHKGVIYILTNPSFKEYVKIGYAHDIEKRLLVRTYANVAIYHIVSFLAVKNLWKNKIIYNLLDKRKKTFYPKAERGNF